MTNAAARRSAVPIEVSAGPSSTRIGYFLRHSGDLHYFAAIRPYLDQFLCRPGVDNHVLVPHLDGSCGSIPEYHGYTHLFTSRLAIDDCDLVLTPTFLRPEDRPGPGNGRTRIVQIFHGMSDKPFTYERDFSAYALCLCAGRRQLDRLLGSRHNRRITWAMIGYPKFDAIPEAPRFFDNGKKTLIYCPTWRKGGISSVELFLGNEAAVADLAARCNLIVKPHPNIFNPSRPFFEQSIVERLERLDRFPGVRLVRSGNAMIWFAQADLFIGDISAAGYEWLYFNRPMVFLNPRPRDLHPSRDASALTYLWQCGAVCDDIGQIGPAVDQALRFDGYAPIREAVLHYSVHRPRDRGAAARGVAAIQALLGIGGSEAQGA
jgi:hypothetical protein